MTLPKDSLLWLSISPVVEITEGGASKPLLLYFQARPAEHFPVAGTAQSVRLDQYKASARDPPERPRYDDFNMDAHEFQPGDTVRVKSGGPLMTVDGVGKYGMGATKDSVQCVWFETVKGQQVKKTDDFSPHLLVKE